MQLYEAFHAHNVAQYGIGIYLLGNASFWFSILLVYIITASLRIAEKAIHQLWRPNDVEILAEHEKMERKGGHDVTSKTSQDLELTHHTDGGENGEVRPLTVPRTQNSSDGRWLD